MEDRRLIITGLDSTTPDQDYTVSMPLLHVKSAALSSSTCRYRMLNSTGTLPYSLIKPNPTLMLTCCSILPRFTQLKLILPNVA